jgi:hypothetical protein
MNAKIIRENQDDKHNRAKKPLCNAKIAIFAYAKIN